MAGRTAPFERLAAVTMLSDPGCGAGKAALACWVVAPHLLHIMPHTLASFVVTLPACPPPCLPSSHPPPAPPPIPVPQVSTGNLERVRKVKTRHQRLIIRCETLRDELERYLHDDDDMVKMCLTRRKELEEQYKAVRNGGGTVPRCRWAANQPPGKHSVLANVRFC